jgi:hypothetical protein
VSEAFYLPAGDGFEPTELTRGPWDPEAQHAGPPAALIGRELERCPSPVAPRATWLLGRVTYEILRPVPIAPLSVSARVERPGRSVEMLSAVLSDRDGECVRARGWRIATGSLVLPPGLASEEPSGPGRRGDPPPGPERGSPTPFLASGQAAGYHTAMDARFVSGSFRELGPATVWMRMRHPLVAGEEPTALQRVLVAADSGNGVSATLDFERYVFVNVDLTVHLHRLPAGEWVCVDALTIPEPTGLGVADSLLRDERGPIGRAVQTLLVRER